MLKKISALIIFTSLVICCTDSSSFIRERKEIITTYSYSDPDATPRPDRNYYPYFRFEGYSHHSDSMEWKVIEMENKYIKVFIYPEIGGKVWGAVEKTTGNDFIYNNSVVKFRNIAMRGPWTSGGIEFNFGTIGHVPTTSTPVDYYTKKNKDGSVSCFVGAIELLTRTRWEAEINLQPDKAYFTTKIKWSNPTPFIQPYYQWCNAAFQAQGNLQMFFPGNYRIGHDGIAKSWPIDENGMDRSIYANNKMGDESNHIIGTTEGFYAAYWHDLNFGSGNYSMHGDKLGKKIFLWSQNRSGGIWENLLTDNDGQYVELQTGRLFNQANDVSTLTPFQHRGFFPGSVDNFLEYWFPVMNIGGVVKANEIGAINVIKQQDSQVVYLSPLQRIEDNIKIYTGEELVYNTKIKVDPLEVWKVEIPLNSTTNPLRIIVGTYEKLIYEEDNDFNSRPVNAPTAFDWNSIYGLYLSGLNYLFQGNYSQALSNLQVCLERDSLYAPALNMIAEMYLRKYDLENALLYARKSLSINTYDPSANFLSGLIAKYQGNFTDAQDGFAVASLSNSYRNASYIQLAQLFILKNDLFRAKQYAERIATHESNNEDALLLLSIISRKLGNDKAAFSYAKRIEEISPLNHFSRFEKLMVKNNSRNKEHFISLISNELPSQTYMEMAYWYKDLGCYDEAIELLEIAPGTSLVNLQLSLLFDEKGNKEKTDYYFSKALESAIDYNYPFRTEEIPLLKWAVGKTDSWKAKYYLALLYWKYGDLVHAKTLFASCNQQPESPYFYLGKLELFKTDSSYDSESDLLKAKDLDSDNWRVYRALIEYYLDKGQVDKALTLGKESLDKFNQNDILKVDYARCLIANNLYSETLNVLENIVILPNEGSSYGKIIYREAAISEGLGYLAENKIDQALESFDKARMWPENLGVGRPYVVDERIEDFLEAECMLKLNEPEQAHELYRKIIDFQHNISSKYRPSDYLHIIALRRLNRNQEAEDFLAKWKRESPDDPLFKWIKNRTVFIDPQSLNSDVKLLKRVLHYFPERI